MSSLLISNCSSDVTADVNINDEDQPVSGININDLQYEEVSPEEVDLLDIQKEINEHVDNEDIAFVYDNLINGSYNHLRAFVRNLSRQGILYEPQLLSEEVYNGIVNN